MMPKGEVFRTVILNFSSKIALWHPPPGRGVFVADEDGAVVQDLPHSVRPGAVQPPQLGGGAVQGWGRQHQGGVYGWPKWSITV